MDRKNNEPIDLLYKLDDKPPVGRSFLYALQWLIVFLPMLTMVSVLAGEVLGLSVSDQEFFFQRLLIVTGSTMMLQTLFGHKLPLLDGPAMALVITLAALASEGLGVVSGGMLAGGVLLFVLGALGLMRYVIPLFSDRVIGVILLLISLVVIPILLPMLTGVDSRHPNGQPIVLILGVFLIVLMGLFYHYAKGLTQSLSIFIGVFTGMVIYAMLGLVDLSPVHDARWISSPGDLLATPIQFKFSAVLSFVLAYLAVIVNSVGSMFSLEPILAPGNMEKRLNRGMAFTGLSGIMAGIFGTVGTVQFSTSPGIIAVTGVGSRFVVLGCGLLVLGIAFLGKFTALINAVPGSIVAAALIVGLAAQIGVSVEAIMRGGEKLSGRDYLVVGLPVILGSLASLLPKGFVSLLPAVMQPLVGNGLIVGVVSVILLEHVVFRKKRAERQST